MGAIPPLPVLAVLEMIPKVLKVLATEWAFPLTSCNSLFCTSLAITPSVKNLPTGFSNVSAEQLFPKFSSS